MPPVSPAKTLKDGSDKEQRPLLQFEDDPFEDVSLISTDAHRQEDSNRSARRTRPHFTGNSEEEVRPGSDSSFWFEMRSRAKRPDLLPALNPSFVFVDVPIEPDDTLPSFAIKYHVTIAELKRINNLFHDQDFYGRQKLRVPIHKYGILAEKFLPHLSRDPDAPGTSSSTSVLVDLGSPTPTNASDNDENMDRDLSRLTREALERPHLSPVSETEILTNRNRIEPLDGLGCDGADFGIPIRALLCMMLILTIILPGAFVIYKIYCANHPDSCPDAEIHHSNNPSGS